MHAVSVEAIEFCRLLLPILDQTVWALTWATVFLQLHGSCQSLISGAAVRRSKIENVHESVAQWCTMYINDTKSMRVTCTLWHELVHESMFAHLQHWQFRKAFFLVRRTVRLLAVVPDAELPGLVHLGQEDMDLHTYTYPAQKCSNYVRCAFVITISNIYIYISLPYCHIVLLRWYP